MTMVGTLRENASDVMGLGFSSAPPSPGDVAEATPGSVSGAGKGGAQPGRRASSGAADDKSADAKGADGKGTAVPSFMSYFNRQAAAQAAAAAPAPPPAPAPAPAPAPVKELYEQLCDSSFLTGLSRDELEDKLYELDAQFRRDMASLTERYDAARTALETEMEKH